MILSEAKVVSALPVESKKFPCTSKYRGFLFAQSFYMKNIDLECRKVLNKLKNCNPNEVGKILKEYFNLKRKSKNR
jgi:hypothetical protein